MGSMYLPNSYRHVFCHDDVELEYCGEDLVHQGLGSNRKIIVIAPSWVRNRLGQRFCDVLNHQLFFLPLKEYRSFFIGGPCQVRANAKALVKQAAAEGRLGVVMVQYGDGFGENAGEAFDRARLQMLIAAIAGLPLSFYRLHLAAEKESAYNAPALQVSLASITVDRYFRRAIVQGRAVGLSPLESELLSFLVRHPGKVFHRRELMKSVWGHSFGDETVAVHIHRLRRKIEADPRHPTLIQSVRGVGYCFCPSPRFRRSP